MRLLPAVLLASVLSWSAWGQTYTISTFAGGALPVNIPGTSAILRYPPGVAVDGVGNLFFVDQHNVVLRLDATTGVLTLVAGNGTPGYSGDNGQATRAELGHPLGVAVDSAGNLYIADTGNYRVRMVANGVITTVAGNGTPGYSGDNGPATSAQLYSPDGIAVDAAGNLYIADYGNNRIRKVSNGVITTVAGNGTQGFGGDNGPAISAQLDDPYGIAVDSAGNLYIADYGNDRIRKVSNGVITTVAGNGTPGYSGDNGQATSAELGYPFGVAVDAAGNLYIADRNNQLIRKVSNGVITTVAGNGTSGYSGDNGPATSAELYSPLGVAVDVAGNLYIADSNNQRIRKVSNGVITTAAGGGSSLGDNGLATNFQLYYPSGVAADRTGSLYIADFNNMRVRKVSSGVITTVAGGGSSLGDNGPATSAALSYPAGVFVDPAGSLYIADFDNQRIREVSNGVITTVAGNGQFGFSGDNGPATGARLNFPRDVALDAAGSLYIADKMNNRIRKVSSGVITTVAGTGTAGYGGDNGPATSAQLYSPSGIAVDAAGNLYIADDGNDRIRKVSNGVITTVAGNGTQGFGGDNGPATSAQLNGPAGVAVDAAGNLYVADANNSRVREVSNGVIITVAGNGTAGYSGDNGPATSAQLNFPSDVTVDSAGDVYVADYSNDRIRILIPSGPSCSATVTPLTLSPAASGGNFTLTVQTSSTSCAWAIQNLPDWITFSGSAVGTGPGSVTLSVAANSGGLRTANVSIAGVSVTVTQPAPPPPCTYAITPGGQAFAAAGGTGTINITAGAGCSWTAASTASWITITGVGTGTGNGSVTFQAAANTGADRSGTVAVAGLSFTVEEAAASITGLASAGSMAQLASAGYWTTTITLVNTGSSPAQARLSFFDDNGNPLPLPLSFPSSSSGGAIPLVLLLASTVDRTVNPGAKLLIQTTGANSSPTLVGWAQLLTNGAIGGYAVFSQAIGSADQEAEVPLENRNAAGYVVPFDNTNGAATGIALANISAQAANITVTIRDSTGAVLLTDTTLTIPALGHTSFNLTDRYASTTAQQSGTLEFRTPSAGQISVLGLRFNSTGAFTTIPAIAK